MGKIIKKILKTILILIIVVLNVLIWGRIFISCDAPITQKILLDKATAQDFRENPLSYTVNEYFPPITMDELGKVQLRYVTHIEETDDFQFTLKYNIKFFEDKTPLSYVLRCVSKDSERVIDCNAYAAVDRYNFRYQRFSYKDIGYKDGDVIFLDVYTSDGELFTTLTLRSPDITRMHHKTVSLKTMTKE